ncbi:MAG: DNA-directed polymerase [Anaerocolumna sp.]|jgi:RNA polymerase sigma factor (sigma-70 family)|nr:DNA-directed polymerase [Anaerocolumna sp.]
MIIDEVYKIQSGDNTATLKLIEKFKPILKKYAHSLSYEDAYDDLLVDFIELLNTLKVDKIQNKNDGCMVAYLTTSIHNSYIKKLIKVKQLRNFTTYSELSENELHYIDSLTATKDTYVNTDYDLLRKLLTNQEFNIIKMLYYDGYTVTETALAISVTRQAVNQMKNRALKKLKNIFMDKH